MGKVRGKKRKNKDNTKQLKVSSPVVLAIEGEGKIETEATGETAVERELEPLNDEKIEVNTPSNRVRAFSLPTFGLPESASVGEMEFICSQATEFYKDLKQNELNSELPYYKIDFSDIQNSIILFSEEIQTNERSYLISLARKEQIIERAITWVKTEDFNTLCQIINASSSALTRQESFLFILTHACQYFDENSPTTLFLAYLADQYIKETPHLFSDFEKMTLSIIFQRFYSNFPLCFEASKRIFNIIDSYKNNGTPEEKKSLTWAYYKHICEVLFAYNEANNKAPVALELTLDLSTIIYENFIMLIEHSLNEDKTAKKDNIMQSENIKILELINNTLTSLFSLKNNENNINNLIIGLATVIADPENDRKVGPNIEILVNTINHISARLPKLYTDAANELESQIKSFFLLLKKEKKERAISNQPIDFESKVIFIQNNLVLLNQNNRDALKKVLGTQNILVVTPQFFKTLNEWVGKLQGFAKTEGGAELDNVANILIPNLKKTLKLALHQFDTKFDNLRNLEEQLNILPPLPALPVKKELPVTPCEPSNHITVSNNTFFQNKKTKKNSINQKSLQQKNEAKEKPVVLPEKIQEKSKPVKEIWTLAFNDEQLFKEQECILRILRTAFVTKNLQKAESLLDKAHSINMTIMINAKNKPLILGYVFINTIEIMQIYYKHIKAQRNQNFKSEETFNVYNRLIKKQQSYLANFPSLYQTVSQLLSDFKADIKTNEQKLVMRNIKQNIAHLQDYWKQAIDTYHIKGLAKKTAKNDITLEAQEKEISDGIQELDTSRARAQLNGRYFYNPNPSYGKLKKRIKLLTWKQEIEFFQLLNGLHNTEDPGKRGDLSITSYSAELHKKLPNLPSELLLSDFMPESIEHPLDSKKENVRQYNVPSAHFFYPLVPINGPVPLWTPERGYAPPEDDTQSQEKIKGNCPS